MIHFAAIFGSMLNQTYQNILGLVELDAELEAATIARKLGLKTASVQKALQRLIEMQVIVGRTVMIDLNKLGITEYGINIKLDGDSATNLQEVASYLTKQRAVSWLAEMQSDVDFMFNVVSPSAYGVNRFLNKFAADTGIQLARKEFCIRVERMRFWRGYLGRKLSTGLRFHSTSNCKVEEIDAADKEILSVLSTMKFESMRDLAAQAGIPIASFLRRIKRLREKKVILGLGYRIDPSCLNMQQYRLHISAELNSHEVLKQLKTISAESPWIKMLAVCLGPWDYEMEVDVPNLRELKALQLQIQKATKTSKLHVESHALVQHLKYINFPAAELS